MIAFLRSTDGNPDSRLQKYIDVVVEKKISFLVFCWDRNLKFTDNKNYVYYHKKAVYGSGMKNMTRLLGFNLFLFKQLISNRKNIEIIHACDFDTILPAIFMKIFFHKKVIYDIFDWFVDSRELHNPFIKSCILSFEYIALKLSDRTIVCEEERKKQIKFQPKNIWVLPNIPNFKPLNTSETEDIGTPIKVSYVGVLTKHRGIEKVIKYAETHPDQINLEIAGFGELEELIKQACKKVNNIHYWGTVPYEKGIEIMKNSDIILAIYEKTIPNHIYAAPNKYYEGLYLGKPILTTKDTYVGIKTEKYNTGFTINEDINELKTLFSKENLRSEINRYKVNARNLWKTKYSNYISTFMNEVYIPFILLNAKKHK